MKIACYPAKRSINIKYQFSPEYYDVSDIVNFEGENCSSICCLENWGKRILSTYERNAVDKMIKLFQRSEPSSKPIHLVWDGKSNSDNIYELMVPAGFISGDPIFFNLENMTVEFK